MIKILYKCLIICVCFSFYSSENRFDLLINDLKGKVVYVDIWATWCAPCVKSIPDTKRVKEKYINKNVEVVFLSIDGDKKKWEEVSKKFNILDRNCIITGYVQASNSKTLSKIQIKEIPRYLIFNKKGILVNDNAPRPAQKIKLAKELEKYLKE